MVMMVWQAELHQGKQSIILDAKKPAARDVIRKAVESADVMLLNKMDNQLVSLGLSKTLDVVNEAVLLQLKAAGAKYDEVELERLRPGAAGQDGAHDALRPRPGRGGRQGRRRAANFGVASCVTT